MGTKSTPVTMDVSVAMVRASGRGRGTGSVRVLRARGVCPQGPCGCEPPWRTRSIKRARTARRGAARSRQRRGRAALAEPLSDQTAEVGDEALVLVRRIRGADGVDEQRVEVARAHPVE